MDVPSATDAPVLDAPTATATDAAASTDARPTCDCPTLVTCRVLRRRPLAGEAGREHGLSVRGGLVRCDPQAVACPGPLPYERGAEVWDLTESCGFLTDRLLVIGRDVYAWQAMSVGERGGPGYALARTRVTDARALLPFGLHFLGDVRRVYRDGPVEGADIATFRVVDCPATAGRCVAVDDRARYYEAERGWEVVRVPR